MVTSLHNSKVLFNFLTQQWPKTGYFDLISAIFIFTIVHQIQGPLKVEDW